MAELIVPKGGTFKRVTLETRGGMFFSKYESDDALKNPVSLWDAIGILRSGLLEAEQRWLAALVQAQIDQQAALHAAMSATKPRVS